MISDHLIHDLPIVRYHTAPYDLIFKIELEAVLIGIPEFIDQVKKIGRIHLTGMHGHFTG